MRIYTMMSSWASNILGTKYVLLRPQLSLTNIQYTWAASISNLGLNYL